MAQTLTLPDTTVLERYDLAAVQLACIVDTLDRIANNPTPADSHGPAADEYRARRFAEALADFRAAREALTASVTAREIRRSPDVHPAHEEIEP